MGMAQQMARLTPKLSETAAPLRDFILYSVQKMPDRRTRQGAREH